MIQFKITFNYLLFKCLITVQLTFLNKGITNENV